MINTKQLETEAFFQKSLLEKIEGEGFTKVEMDEPNLYPYIGQVKTFKVYYDCFTDKLLCKIHVVGYEGYHFIPLWQMIKFCGTEVVKNGCLPEIGEEFDLTVVVGPRRILDTNQWVPALRLPRK